MIDRYTRPEMGHIFSLENKYAIWQEIEVLACEAQAELGKIGISKDEAQWIRDHANFEKAKVDEIEEVTRHDVIAFLTNMKEYIDADVPEDDPKPSRWVHYGMTSSDLGDTALCYMADPEVAALAKAGGTTRAVASMQRAAQEHPGAVLAVGNAPTALLTIAEKIENGLRPALVIGVPVGFVNVVESKERLFSVCESHGVPAIVAMGRKGGSNVAAAICNALIYSAAEMLDPTARGWK